MTNAPVEDGTVERIGAVAPRRGQPLAVPVVHEYSHRTTMSFSQ